MILKRVGEVNLGVIGTEMVAEAIIADDTHCIGIDGAEGGAKAEGT